MAQLHAPRINAPYAGLTQHSGFIVIPAPVGKPQDKALVGIAVPPVSGARNKLQNFYQRTPAILCAVREGEKSADSPGLS